MKNIILMLLALIPVALHSQNLIPNGGFEEYHKLPDKDGCFNDYIKNWSNLNGKKGYPNATPDFLHKKGSNSGKTSSYYYAEVEPYSGDAMMGVIVMPGRPFYEYVAAHVAIKKGKRYEFSMYINNGAPKYCGCSGKGLGVYFSNQLPVQKEAEFVDKKPQWMINEPFYTQKWENIKFKFTASEDFNYITIGYFLPPDKINMNAIDKSSNCIYFFIDELSLVEIQENSTNFEQVSLPKNIKNVETSFETVKIEETAKVEEPKIFTLTANIVVIDNTTDLPIAADISVIQLDTKKEIQSVMSDAYMTFQVPDPSKKYGIFAKLKGFIDGSDNIEPITTLTENKKINKIIALSPIKKGEKIVLKNIYFDTGKADLLPTSFIELDKLTTFLTENPEINVEISGHTDSDGADQMNLDLSQRRAKSVVNYLQKKISANRLKPAGYGETMPVAPNTTTEGKQLNRRVEFKIL